jgi:hypothetical protein
VSCGLAGSNTIGIRPVSRCNTLMSALRVALGCSNAANILDRNDVSLSPGKRAKPEPKKSAATKSRNELMAVKILLWDMVY